MKDEIKEILDKLKDNDWYDELDLTGDKWIELKQTETKQILDYITNLQGKANILEETNATLIQQKYDLERELDVVLEKKDNLQQENERIEKEYKNKVDDIGKLTSRIYKAIKKLKERKNEVDEDLWVEMRTKDYFEECDEIINILQNGSEENERDI